MALLSIHFRTFPAALFHALCVLTSSHMGSRNNALKIWRVTCLSYLVLHQAFEAYHTTLWICIMVKLSLMAAEVTRLKPNNLQQFTHVTIPEYTSFIYTANVSNRTLASFGLPQGPRGLHTAASKDIILHGKFVLLNSYRADGDISNFSFW